MNENLKTKANLIKELNALKQEAHKLRKKELKLSASIKKLEEKKERFQLALEASRQGLWEWDFVNNEIYFSPGFYKIIGYDPSELKLNYDAWRNLIHPKDINYVEEKYELYKKGKQDSIDIRYRIKTKHGSWRWILSKDKIIAANKNGNAKKMIGVISDITVQQLYEDALRESRIVNERIIETVPGLLFIYDLKGNNLVSINPQVTSILGYQLGEVLLVSKNMFGALVHPDDRSLHAERMHRLQKAKENEIIESLYRIKDSNGNWHWLSNRDIIFSKTDKDEPYLILGTSQDVSQRKETEEALRNYERTFVKSLMDAEEKERKRIARELHGGIIQLLMVSNLKLEIAQKKNNIRDKNFEDAKKLIQDAGKEIKAIVNALHSLVIDNYGLVESLSILCKEFSELNNINIKFKAYCELDKLDYDVQLSMYRIVQEALTNISKHANASEAALQIFERQHNIYIVIEDNGTGFNAADLFTPASKIPTAGLMHMKERTELLGGKFKIESQLDNGTEIHIEIPFIKKEHT